MKKMIKLGLKMGILALFYPSIWGCVVTVKNDSEGKILIVDDRENVGEAMEIGKGKQKKWGQSHEKVHMVIYIKEPHARIYTAQYIVDQRQCAGGKEHPHISIKDIKAGTFDKNLFAVTGYQDASSSLEPCCGGTQE
ncbi:MAG TPA: hypothetical protein VEK38_00855 [Candidatus Bathyarchaeia archaeon]|nr:hypothetical protein [Candidatus Bathyarchaeia archaeon]